MSNRILLDNTGLKISKPTLDVLTADDEDLIFSSDWSQASIYTRGQLSISSGSQTINYGKTFTNIPMVCFLRYETDGRLMVNEQALWFNDPFGDTGFWGLTIRTGASSFIVRAAAGGGAIKLKYVVWDFDL